MKKNVFKYSSINFIVGILLFVAYRLIISKTETVDNDWLDFIVNILDIFLNLHFALFGLIVMLMNSFCILLNLNEFVRQKFWISFLSFLAIPILYFGYAIYLFSSEMKSAERNIFTNFLYIAIAYLLLTSIAFLVFQNNIKKRSENDL